MTPVYVGLLVYLGVFGLVGALKSTSPADLVLALISSSAFGLAAGLVAA